MLKKTLLKVWKLTPARGENPLKSGVSFKMGQTIRMKIVFGALQFEKNWKKTKSYLSETQQYF